MAERDVLEVTAESMNAKCFNAKKFKSDKEYRCAVLEGVRLAMRRGEVFSDEVWGILSMHSLDTSHINMYRFNISESITHHRTTVIYYLTPITYRYHLLSGDAVD